MNARKLQALRNLAERPGTEAEGKLARELLARFESQPDTDESEPWDAFEAYCRQDITTDAFLDALRRWTDRERGRATRTEWVCPCGRRLPVSEKCRNTIGHIAIQTEIRGRFQIGDRVFYNYHAYEKNTPGRVSGYVKLKPENGTHPWAWISVKFDYLKNSRAIPIYSEKGWHLSHEPLSDDALRKAGLRGSMDWVEDLAAKTAKQYEERI